MDEFLKNIEGIITILITLSIVSEQFVEFIRQFIEETFKVEFKAYVKIFLSMVVSVLMCILAQVEVPYGYNLMPIANQILTGLFISGGSKILHDLLNLIKSIKKNNETKVEAVNTNLHLNVTPEELTTLSEKEKAEIIEFLANN